KTCSHFKPNTPSADNCVPATLSPLLRCAPCLNSDSTASPDKITPAAVPAQKLPQLINDCEPVNE
ncbi:hypothetical protein AVEN_107698-1, partial [Araneus ventricosus]